MCKFTSGVIGGLLTILLSGGCATTGSVIDETLDSTTGVTTIYSHAPLRLYRDRSSSAAYAKDFVDLGPVKTIRMRDKRYFLWVGIWSTMGVSDSVEDRARFGTITILADGEPMQLTLAPLATSDVLAERESYATKTAAATDVYYEVTVDQLRVIGEADDLRLQTAGARARHYLPWQAQTKGHDAVLAFLEYVGH